MASKAAIKNGSKWYIIRAIPGSQRQARGFDRLDGKRLGESILERECRNEGINIYMPAFWVTTIHQRTNKLMDRRLPLLVGYAFVHVSPQDVEKVRRVDSVMCVLKRGKDGDIVTIADEDVGRLMLADHLQSVEHARNREEKAEKGRSHRRNQLNKRLGNILPKGRSKRIPMRMRAEAELEKLPHDLREKVLQLMKDLDAIEKERDSCADEHFGLNLVA